MYVHQYQVSYSSAVHSLLVTITVRRYSTPQSSAKLSARQRFTSRSLTALLLSPEYHGNLQAVAVSWGVGRVRCIANGASIIHEQKVA